jgi:hypothetical protein
VDEGKAASDIAREELDMMTELANYVSKRIPEVPYASLKFATGLGTGQLRLLNDQRVKDLQASLRSTLLLMPVSIAVIDTNGMSLLPTKGEGNRRGKQRHRNSDHRGQVRPVSTDGRGVYDTGDGAGAHVHDRQNVTRHIQRHITTCQNKFSKIGVPWTGTTGWTDFFRCEASISRR